MIRSKAFINHEGKLYKTLLMPVGLSMSRISDIASYVFSSFFKSVSLDNFLKILLDGG